MMKRGIVILTTIAAGLLLYLTACNDSVSPVVPGIEESLDAIPEITPIKGAQDVSVKVSDGTSSYFVLDFDNIAPNEFIANGKREGWCIVYDKPISSGGTVHDGLKVHSTKGDERWQPIRRLFGIKDQLIASDPDITYKEVQVAIWALVNFPVFDLDNIQIDKLPDRMVTSGEINFNVEKARSVVNLVKSEGSSQQSFALAKSTTNNRSLAKSTLSSTNTDKEVCILETDSDTQTVIAPCEDTFWAFGEISFRAELGDGQWGWVFISRPGEANDYFDSTPLIAGAGQDDGSQSAEDFKEHWVGMLEVELDKVSSPNKLSISYSAFDDNRFDIAHLWVGCDWSEELPVNRGGNVPPGQLPLKYGEESDGEFFTTHTFELEIGTQDDFDNMIIKQCAGDIYHIAAHGVGEWYLNTGLNP